MSDGTGGNGPIPPHSLSAPLQQYSCSTGDGIGTSSSLSSSSNQQHYHIVVPSASPAPAMPPLTPQLARSFQTPPLKCRRRLVLDHLSKSDGAAGCSTNNSNSPYPATTPSSGGKRVYQLDEDTVRHDSSLMRLTQRFIDLQTKAGVLNLNEAAAILRVPKRRLYDITNVLEGIGLVDKVGKNSIRWKNQSEFACSSEFQKLSKETVELEEKERNLDVLTQSISAALKLTKEDPTDAVYFYSLFSDIRSIDSFADQTVIAVKAPLEPQPRSSIEVPSPCETGRYEMTVRNESGGALQAYLCPDSAERGATEFAPKQLNSKIGISKPDNFPTGSLMPKIELNNEQYFQAQQMSPLKAGASQYSQQRILSPLKLLSSNSQPQLETLSSNSVNGPLPNDAFLSLDPLEENDPYHLLFMDQHDSLSSLFGGNNL